MTDDEIKLPDLPPIRNGQTIHVTAHMILDETGWHHTAPATFWIEDPPDPNTADKETRRT